MIPKRNNAMPMPGGGAKVAVSVAATPAPEQPATEVLSPAPIEAPVMETTPTLDTINLQPQPPRPRTSGRPGAPIQFSAAVVERMIRDLEQCVTPQVTFSEDVNAMRAEAHKKRESGLRAVLAALKAPA